MSIFFIKICFEYPVILQSAQMPEPLCRASQLFYRLQFLPEYALLLLSVPVLHLCQHKYQHGRDRFCHNPFSMPAGGLDILLKAERGEVDPLTITADQYDLVCNGVELSSGAVRNHDPEIMIKAFEMVRLGEEDVKKKFPAMYNAFCYGAPPHAGIAPGIDRMVREIIPFPMNKSAQDVMMGAPSTVEQKQLDELHIAITCEPEA